MVSEAVIADTVVVGEEGTIIGRVKPATELAALQLDSAKLPSFLTDQVARLAVQPLTISLEEARLSPAAELPSGYILENGTGPDRSEVAEIATREIEAQRPFVGSGRLIVAAAALNRAA